MQGSREGLEIRIDPWFEPFYYAASLLRLVSDKLRLLYRPRSVNFPDTLAQVKIFTTGVRSYNGRNILIQRRRVFIIHGIYSEASARLR